jgi:dual specificity MAP kinase phosphatase
MTAHSPRDIFRHVTGRKGFDYDSITEDVFIGTNMCCQFGFSRELLSKGVRAAISLEKERTDMPVGVEYYLWIPTPDGEPPSPGQLQLGVDTLSFLAGRGIKVFIHCRNGHGRAPMLYLAYLVHAGIPFNDAYARVKAKRPSVHLTEAQERAVRAFAAGGHAS